MDHRTFLIIYLAVLQATSIVHSAAMLDLRPQSLEGYCPGPVTFTCVGTEVGPNFFWVVNGERVISYAIRKTDTFPLPLDGYKLNGTMLDGVINSVSRSPEQNVLNLTSTLNVSEMSVLDGATLRCEDRMVSSNNMIKSNILNIKINFPPPNLSVSCSLFPSNGDGNHGISILLPSTSFTSQYAVDRYRVSVNPDPSSCSSDQVSPSEDYSCSGLVLVTRYTFTVSAINCGDQEGETDTFSTLFNGLPEPSVLKNLTGPGDQEYSVDWIESWFIISGQCTVNGSINYTVDLVDNTGEVVNKTVVTSDSCIDGICSTSVPLETCMVRVQATSLFGNSGKVIVNVAGVRLTATNKSLLITGVVMFSLAVVFLIIDVILAILWKGPRELFHLLLVGCVPAGLSIVLWIVVGFQVGLQENICDRSWQSTRDALVIAAHVISDLAFLVDAVATGIATGILEGVFCCRKYYYYTLAKKFPRHKINLVLDVDNEGEDTHLVRIAETFEDDWDKTVAPALGLTAEEIITIKREYEDKAEQKRQALKVWKDREGENATYNNLLRLLVTCENLSYASSLPELW